MRGLANAKPTQDDTIRIHYNFIRPPQSLGSHTPAKVEGFNLNLGENKVENIMRQAATKQKEGSNVDRFVSQLGNQSKQTQVIKKEDCIETRSAYIV
jgi:hypothetical protein